MQTIPLNTRVVVLPEFRVANNGGSYPGDNCWTGNVEEFIDRENLYLVRYDDGEWDYFPADQLRVIES